MIGAREEEWAKLMRAAMTGDAASYRRFLETVAPHLRAIARSRLSRFSAPPSEAEDIVQEVLLAIHLKRDSWDSTRPIGPWLSAIVRNKMIDALRRKGRAVHVQIDDMLETLEAEDSGGDLDRLDIERLLQQLKEPQRSIVRLISLNGLGIRETAERFRMTEGAVRVSLHRALKKLAALYRREDT